MVFILSLLQLLFFRVRVCTGVPLDVYLLPHTHLDVGWLETFETYYYLNVSQMIPGIIDNLSRDPTKRFAWAEITYFQKWWMDATDNQKSTLRKLVNNKQWEFVDGGLVQHDQAIPTVYDIVSHMTEGVNFILTNFGPDARPRIGWSLDPFGSAASNAAFYALMGYDALVINRIPDTDMDILKSSQSLQFLWYGSSSLNRSESGIFTHVLDSYFCPPDGFTWSWAWPDSEYITKENVVAKANDFGSQVLPRAAWFRTNQLFVPWGCDFMYVNASIVFENTDVLMTEVNANPTKYGYTLRYSTPTEFFTAIHSNSGMTWPIRNNTDFLPLIYGYTPNVNVWSGFFTSRPKLKKWNRIALGSIHSANLAYVFSSTIASSTSINNPKEFCFLDARTHTRQKKSKKINCEPVSLSMSADLDLLSDAKEFHSIALHHDAITGTMCQSTEGCTGGGQAAGDHSVLEDYLRYQAEAIVKAETVLTDSIAILLSKNGSSLPSVFTAVANRDYGGGTFAYNTLLNKEFAVALMTRKTVALIVHNPLAWTRTEAVSLQVPMDGITVTDVTGGIVSSQILTAAFSGDGRGASGFPEIFDQTLTFIAQKIPPLGYTTYFLTPCQVTGSWPFPCVTSTTSQSTEEKTTNTSEVRISESYILSNNFFSLYINDTHGLVAYYDKNTNYNFSLSMNLRYYQSANPGWDGDNAYNWANTGPSQPLANGPNGTLNGVVIQRNPLMDQIYFRVTLQHGYYIRIFHTGIEEIDSHVEVQFDLGITTDLTDLVVEFKSSELGPLRVWTDGNAFEYYERIFNQSRTIAENSWPQQSSIIGRDQTGKYELSILTELGHAVIRENSNSLQLMISRRVSTAPDVVFDDKLDISQRMWFILGSTSFVTPIRRSLLPRKQYPLRFAGSIVTPLTPSQWVTSYRTNFSPITTALPSNIHLFTLAPLLNGVDQTTSIILRLQHIYEKGEDINYSQPVTINLSQIFSLSPYIITSCIEKTLIFSMNKNDLNRWNWLNYKNNNSVSNIKEQEQLSRVPDSNDFLVTLNPLEIKTFQVTFK